MLKRNRYQRKSIKNRTGFAWLELLLALALIALVLQLLPQIRDIVLWAIDVRNWPRTVWFAVNLLVVLVLLGVRFGPQLVDDWRQRRERLTSEHTKQEKQREYKEQREALERMKQAKRRRMY